MTTHTSNPHTMTPDDKIIYQLGYRDAVAGVLAETKDKVKLPDLAAYYETSFKEKHFSHEWHTTPINHKTE